MKPFIIDPAVSSDIEKIKNILLENKLPIDDVMGEHIQFFVVKIDHDIVGVIGLENYGTMGLLRSLAVKNEYKNQKYGSHLINYFMTYCRTNHVDELYLLTTTAATYFKRYGFYEIQREGVPTAIKNTKEFSTLCPKTATIMKKEMK